MEEKFKIDIKLDKLTLYLYDNITIESYKQLDIINYINSLDSNYNSIIINLNFIKKYDSALALLIKQLRDFTYVKLYKFELICDDKNIVNFLDIYNNQSKSEIVPLEPLSPFVKYFTRIGNVITVLYKDGIKFVEFLGDITLKSLNLLIHPRDMRWTDFPLHITNSGVNAVPIVVLIVFLIGIITGYQGAIQLKQFGADIYIADIVSISITRELAPLMAAILAAGRSGASFAAEIGTMKVSEEIDALNSMGFDHIKFLVLPRIAAVMFAMPFVTVIADFFGILGGLIAGLSILNITILGFINQMQISLTYGDIFSGLVKSIIFGYLISTVGCFRGLQVSGGAESVGRYTTASVVTGVLLIIVTDAVLIFVLQALGI